MKKNIFNKLSIFVVLAALLSFNSCKNALTQNTETAYLNVSIDDSRTIFPDFTLDDMEFELYGSLNGANERLLGSFYDFKMLKTDAVPLETGNWDFKLVGYITQEHSITIPQDFNNGCINGEWYNNSDGISYKGKEMKYTIRVSSFTGTNSTVVKKGNNAVNFTLNYDENYFPVMQSFYYYDDNGQYKDFPTEDKADFYGKGKVELTIKLPSSPSVFAKAQLNRISINYNSEYFNNWDVSYIYNSFNELQFEEEEVDIEDDILTYSHDNLPIGYYELTINFYKDFRYSIPVNTYKEIVKIAAGCTSKAEREITNLNNKFYKINYVLNDGSYKKGYTAPGSYTPNQVTALPSPMDLVRDNYVLEGFYLNSDFSGNRLYEINGLEEDITLYAKWVRGIAVSSDTISSKDFSSESKAFTLVYVGELIRDDGYSCSTLANKIKASGSDINLILYNCKELPEYAFYDCKKLVSLSLPTSLSSIGYCGFEYCSVLTKVYLPETIKKLDSGAFGECSSLHELYITDLSSYLNISCDWGMPFSDLHAPEEVNKIYLNGTLIKDLVIPSGVTEIPCYAFRNTELSSVTIPNSVNKIGNCAFYGCSSLKTVYISSLNSYLNINSNDNYNGGGVFNSSDEQNKVILNGEEIIDLVIPSTVKSIPEYAFRGTSIKSITIPATLKEIKFHALTYCKNLESLKIADLTSFLKIKKNGGWDYTITYHSNNLVKLYINDILTSEIEIPNTITSIPAYEFCNIDISSIKISDGITVIGEQAFNKCRNLKRIDLPDSLMTIRTGVFWDINSSYDIYVSNEEKYNSISKSDSGINGTLVYTDTKHDVTFYYSTDGITNRTLNLSHNELLNAAELEELTDDNKFFCGWYFDQDYTNQVTSTFRVTEDKTVYAKWVDKVTINYDTTDSTTEPFSKDYAKGLELTAEMLPYLTNSNDSSLYFSGWSYNNQILTIGSVIPSTAERTITLTPTWTSFDIFAANDDISRYTIINTTSSSPIEYIFNLSRDSTYVIEWIDNHAQNNLNLGFEKNDCVYEFYYLSSSTSSLFRNDDDATRSYNTTSNEGEYVLKIMPFDNNSTSGIHCAFHLYQVVN